MSYADYEERKQKSIDEFHCTESYANAIREVIQRVNHAWDDGYVAGYVDRSAEGNDSVPYYDHTNLLQSVIRGERSPCGICVGCQLESGLLAPCSSFVFSEERANERSVR